MAQQTINVGTAPNDGTGTPLRTAFQYTNSNFTELYTATGPSGNNINVPGAATISGNLTVDTNTFFVDSANNRVGVGTVSPQQNLHVFGTGTQTIAVERDGATIAGRFEFVSGNSTNLVRCVTAKDLVFEQATGTEVYRIAANGVATWSNVGGVAGTAMTLNSTGLGVGVSPGYKLDVAGSSAGVLRLVNISNSSTDPAAVTRLSLDGQGATWHLDNERTNGIFKITRNSTACLTIDNSGNLILQPSATPATLTTNGQLTVNATSNTNLRFSYRGSDGVTRVANITLA